MITVLEWVQIGDKCKMRLGLDDETDISNLPTTDAESQALGIPHAPAAWSEAIIANDSNNERAKYYFDGSGTWSLMGK